MKRIIILSVIIMVIMALIISNILSCYNFINKSTNVVGSATNLVNGAKHIDTDSYKSKKYDVYNSVLFDPATNKYYISGSHDQVSSKLALISINGDLTLNYSKYYEVKSDNIKANLKNLWYKDNSTFYVAGGFVDTTSKALGYGNHTILGSYCGILGEADKTTGQITLKKIFKDIGYLYIISYKNNIYVLSDWGYLLKLDNNYNVILSKQVRYSYFEGISLASNYLITYDYRNGSVVIIDKSLSNAIRFHSSISHVALVDSNNKLYYIDRNSYSGRLVLTRVNINTLSSPIQEVAKEYNWSAIGLYAQMGFSADGNILVGITTQECLNNILLLKIKKDDLSIINQVKLSAKGLSDSKIWGSLNIMSLPDRGFVISGGINYDMGYILKGPSDLNIGNNLVFKVVKPHLTEVVSTYTIKTTNLTLDNVTVKEIDPASYKLVEVKLNTVVGYKKPDICQRIMLVIQRKIIMLIILLQKIFK